MKKLFSILLTALLVLGLLTSCAGGEKPYSAYSEICDTESYYENIVSMPALFTNFSVGKYANFYVSYNGMICKFYDTGEMTQTYEGTLGFSAPYFYDGYIYAVVVFVHVQNRIDTASAKRCYDPVIHRVNP